MTNVFHRAAAFALCAILANPMPPSAMPFMQRCIEDADGDGSGYRYRRGKGLNNRRGKGKRNPPRSRSNRMHISKRVRRKHRRAA